MASSARIDELKKKFDENPRRYFAPLANEYRKVGDLDQALFICEAYLPQQPGHMSGHIVYAQTLFEMARYDDSKAAFGTALALDPENLIALRHLGDIARQAGDLNTAREWYQRVLEADPRNEEIVEVMASLRQAGAAPSSPMASTAPAEVPPAMQTPVFSAPPPVQASPTPVSSAPASPPADADFEEEHELLDLDSMMLGETPLSTPAVPGPATPADDEAAFESDPLAIAATEPPIELATDLHLGLIDDGTQSDVAPVSDAPQLEGLRSFEPGIIPERAEIVDSSLEMEPFYDILHGDATPSDATPSDATPSKEVENQPSVSRDEHAPAESAAEESVAAAEGAAPSFELDERSSFELDERTVTPAVSSASVRQPTPPVAGEIFVTETMAELYLRQGHLDSALDIYRRLLAQRPDDASLVERVRSVEEQLFGPPAEPVGQGAEIDSASAAAATQSGPTIREFLNGLIAGKRTHTSESNGTSSSGSAPAESGSRHTLPGSIDAMFPHAGPSTVDSTAATALGEAFGMDDFDVDLPNEMPRQSHNATATGEHPEPSDGSLSSEGISAAEGFSFDQFFSGDSNATPAKQPSAETGAPPVESPDDIAQFNAWLSGLKKT